MSRTFFMKTDRVGFSKWKEADTDLVSCLWGNAEVTRFICASGMFTEDEIMTRLERWMTPHVTEQEVKQVFVKAVNELFESRDAIIEGIDLMQKILCDVDGLEEDRIRLENEISVVRELTKNVVAVGISGLPDQSDSRERYDNLAKWYEAAPKELEEVKAKKQHQLVRIEALEQFKKQLLSQDGIMEEFDSDLWGALVEYVTVKTDKRVVVTFRDGTEIEEKIE